MRGWARGVVVSLVVGLWSVVAAAQPTPEHLEAAARTHFELGRDHYAAGRFEEAAREFREAHRLSGRAELQYNIHIAERDAGNLVAARDALRAFLDSGVEAAERDRASLESRLVTLERQIAREAPARDGGAADGDGAADPSSGPPAFAWGLVVAGGLSTAAAIVLGVLALSLQSDLEERCADGICRTEDAAADVDRGNTLTLAADITGIAGLVAIAVGAIVIVASSDAEADPSTAAAEAWTWRF